MHLRQLIGLISLLVLVLLTPSTRALAIETEKQNVQGNYTTVIPAKNGFVAANQLGRIDWISGKGEITQSDSISGHILNSLLFAEKCLIVAGDSGSLWIGEESGAFKKTKTETDQNINSLVFFNGKIIAAADKGELTIGNVNGSFKTMQLELEGNIVSISANTTDCYGVTDQGEIIQSKDGNNWNVFDFNKIYKGFYKPCQFSKVYVTEKQISIIGKQDDGLPVMFYSNRGTVWTQRNLVYTVKNGSSTLLNESLNDIFYDEARDQFMLITNHGKLMTIPSCSHCNKLFEIGSTNLKSITGNEDTLIVVGEGAFLITEQIDNF